MKLTYTAIFQHDEDGICISFPDVPYCLSCAFSYHEAIEMATEALELSLDEIPVEEIPNYRPKSAVTLGPRQEAVEISVELENRDGILFSSKVIRAPGTTGEIDILSEG